MNLEKELNTDQKEAVVAIDGPSLVIAGAGSGKTRVLTYKIAYMIEQGVDANHILALTFTNKAAREMRERIYKLVGGDEARHLWMGTFHSVAARMLRQDAQALGYTPDFTIYDTTDSKSLVKQIVKEMELDDKVYKAAAVLSRISMAKNSLLSPVDYASNNELIKADRMNRMGRMADIFYTYNKRLQAANAMDFDDLLFNLNLLLSRFTEIRQKWQQQFSHILVDEYQDTNHSQYRIVTCLAKPQDNICVVGDDAQSIYSFRGADISNILHFQEQYQHSKLFQLRRNYRSTQNIVNAANSLIKHNINQIPKNVYSENEIGNPVMIATLNSDRDEAAFITRQINLLSNSKNYNDFSVLYRTNAQSRVLEDELRKANMPYRIYGGLSFYQRKEIKDSLAYFRLAVNPQDDEALIRIINFPARGIGETTVRRLIDVAHQNNISALQVTHNPLMYSNVFSGATAGKLQRFATMMDTISAQITMLGAYDFAKFVLTVTQILSTAAQDTTPEGQDKYQNLQELLTSLHEYEEQQKENGIETIQIQQFLGEVALLTDQDENIGDDTPRVTLMTVHSAKGLEFPTVFIAGMEEKLFPSMFAFSTKEIEEERRLFYVAITRAKERCVITSAKQRFRNGQMMFSNESQFLRDIDPKFTQRWNDIRIKQPAPMSTFSPFSKFKPVASTATPTATPTAATSTAGSTELVNSPYEAGRRVQHSVFGKGTIIQAYRENGNDKIQVKFDLSGTKTLLLKFAKIQLL